MKSLVPPEVLAKDLACFDLVAGTKRNRSGSEEEFKKDSNIGPNDVLLGRGAGINSFSGNKHFRTIVSDHQLEYLSARRKDKLGVANKIVALIHESGGRFLRKHDASETWVEIPLERAREKTAQALREGLDVRKRTTPERPQAQKKTTPSAQEQTPSAPSAQKQTPSAQEQTPSAQKQTMVDPSIGPNDVLLGRGGLVNSYSGNKRFRTIVSDHQLEYLAARKKDKPEIGRKIVALINESGGRFLQKDDSSDTWVEVSAQKSSAKTLQALREGLDFRNRTTRPSRKLLHEAQNASGKMRQTLKCQGHPQTTQKTKTLVDPNVGPSDVLLGRGAEINNFSGNKHFRTLVIVHQGEYLSARTEEKAAITCKIVSLVHESGGRFLRKDDSSDRWVEVSMPKAMEKTAQALRDTPVGWNRAIRANKQPLRSSLSHAPAEGEQVSTLGEKVSTSGDKASTSGDKASISGDKASTLGEKASISRDKASASGDKASASGDKASTSGDKASTSEEIASRNAAPKKPPPPAMFMTGRREKILSNIKDLRELIGSASCDEEREAYETGLKLEVAALKRVNEEEQKVLGKETEADKMND